MNAALLDTDILSEFFRGNPTVVRNVELYLDEFEELNTSVITYYEIRNGLLYKDAHKKLAKFEAFSKINNIIPLTVPMAHKAAEIQAKLREKGVQIGHTDTLIAGIAITSGLRLITNNTAHFSRVSGLEIANWK